MPFVCGQEWQGSTRATHSPSTLSVDWNRDAYDEGEPVVASAPGIVSSVVNLGDTSYGLYVVIDHGGEWSTLHAHLLKALVVVGQRVDLGQPIALVGNSGGSSGAHLHYEQRLNRSDQAAVFNGRPFEYNTWLRSRNCADVPIVGDWNGDGLSDVGTFGRRARSGVFHQRLPGGGFVTVDQGTATDAPVVGDWNGDGQSDLGVWRFDTRVFVLSAADGSHQRFSFGASGDRPVSGDWDGDGRDEVGVFRPATGTFLLRDQAGNVTTKQFGAVSSWPVTGDWDGDGRDEVGVYNPAATTFSLAKSDGTIKTVVFGTPTSLPVVGDWGGAKPVSHVGVWDPGTGVFTKRLNAKTTETVRFGRTR